MIVIRHEVVNALFENAFMQDDASVPCFSDGVNALRPEASVRLKILGIRFDSSQIFGVASLNGDYLGPVEARETVDAEVA